MIGKVQALSYSTSFSQLSIDPCHYKCVAPMALMKPSTSARPLLLQRSRICIMEM